MATLNTLTLGTGRPLTQAAVILDFEDVKDFTGIALVTVTNLAVVADGPVDVELAPVAFAAACDEMLVPAATLPGSATSVALARTEYRFAFNQGAAPPSAHAQGDGNVALLTLSLGAAGTLGASPPSTPTPVTAHAVLTYTVTLTPAPALATEAVQTVALELPAETPDAAVYVELPKPAGEGFILFQPEKLVSEFGRTDLAEQKQGLVCVGNAANTVSGFGHAHMIHNHTMSGHSNATKNYRRTPRPFVVAVNGGKPDGNACVFDDPITAQAKVNVAILALGRPVGCDSPLAATLHYRLGVYTAESASGGGSSSS